MGVFFFLVVASITSDQLFAATLTLEQFREQAKLGSTQYQSSKSKLDGAQASRDSYKSLTNLRLFSTFNYVDDKRPTTNPSFQGDRTQARQASIGLKKQTLWGPSIQISQNVSKTIISNASAAAVPIPEYYDLYPSIDLSIPLWRNLLGQETRAQYDKLKAFNQAQLKRAEAESILTDADIDMAYFTLQAQRESVELQRELLARAEKIQSWVRTQNKRGLADPSDVHQADAAVTLRKLELESALNQLKMAARTFNQFRGRQSDTVEDDLQLPELNLDQLKLQRESTKKRKDLLAEFSSFESQSADYLAIRESFKPELDLKLSTQWVGRGVEFEDATNDSRHQPYVFVGLTFTIPLDIAEMNRTRRGYNELSKSAQLAKKMNQEKQSIAWQNFVDLGEQLHKQVLLVRQLEATQRKKADVENTRFSRGRSTTFQVLNFEQDYINAKNQRIVTELQARRYIAEVSLFE